MDRAQDTVEARGPWAGRALLLYAAVAAAHVATIALARAITRTTTEGVPLWAAAGVTVAVLLLVPRRLWPGVLLASFASNVVCNLVIDVVPATAVGSALANTVEPLVGALVVLHILGAAPNLSRRRDLLVFLAGAAVIGPAVGAAIGAASTQFTPDHLPYVEVLGRWFTGDALGVLIVGSLILAWAAPAVIPPGVVHVRLEALLAGAAVVGLALLAFWGSSPVLAYIVLPPLAWASIRFGVRGATLGGLAVAVIADWATILDHGLFALLAGEENNEALWQLQLFLAVLLVTALLMAAQVSELGHAETAVDVAEAATTAKTQFLASMSHEIRTPMSAVTSLVELLGHTSLDAEQRSLVNTLERSSAALLRIVDDTLDLSKIEAGMLEFESVPIAIDDEIRAIASLMEPAASTKGITLACSAEPATPPTVFGDPVRIRQILLNLVSNAIKFTHRGVVKLDAIVSAPKATGGVDVSFVVRDTGIGIDPDRREELFRPFTQAEQGTTRLYGGTGLGLSIVRRLVEIMDGTIELTSEPGAGSTFVVRLPMPLAPEGALPAPRKPSRPAAAQVDHERFGGHVVLVAEDNAVNRDVLRRQLALIGCACDVTADGREALDRIAGGGISLVLTDCHMPVLDGFELTRTIRAEEQRIAPSAGRLPVVAITANALHGEGERCLAAGMDAYLTKPVDVARLATVLADLLPAEPVRSPDPIDLAVLRAVVGDDDAGVADVLGTFMESVHDQAEAMRAGLAAGQTAPVGSAAHRIAGAAASVGAGRLATLARVVELGAPTAPAAALQSAVAWVIAEIDDVTDAVSHLEARRG